MKKPKFKKVEFSEVYSYAKNQIDYYIKKIAGGLPFEQQEEMAQDGMERVWKAYKRIDRDDWKGFVQQHARGAVLDYIKGGRGFAESKEVIKNAKESVLEKYPDMIRTRLYSYNSKDFEDYNQQENDPELTCAASWKLFEKDDPGIKINWDMVAQMARLDRDLHIVAKLLLGFEVKQLTEIFQCKRVHIHQRFNVFMERLDDPNFIGDNWVENIIWALGVQGHYGLTIPPKEITFYCAAVDLWADCALVDSGVPIQLSFDF